MCAVLSCVFFHSLSLSGISFMNNERSFLVCEGMKNKESIFTIE